MSYLAATVLFVLLGAYSIAAQIYFIREMLVQFFGNELCLGIFFSAWFIGIGCGAALGGRAGGGRPKAVPAFLISFIVLCLMPFAVLPAMRLLRAAIGVPAGMYASLGHIAAGVFLTVCPFSFMAGFAFPAACRTLIGPGRKGGPEIGWVYVWEAVGSLGGGVVISLVLIPGVPPLVAFGWGCLIIFAVSLGLCSGAPRMQLLLVLLIAAAGAGLAGGKLAALDRFLEHARWKTFDNRLRLVESRDSRYQHISLAEAQGQYSVFANGILTGIYPDDYQAALRAHFLLTQHPDPRRVLLIGGGMTGLLKEVLKHPVVTLDYVELDPELVKIIYPLLRGGDLAAVSDKRVRIHYMDGRRFVRQAPEPYDLIILNAPDPSTALLNRYYTFEFLKEAAARLSRQGLFIAGMSSTADHVSQESADYNSSLYRGLRAVFPRVMVVPGEKNYFFGAVRDNIFTQDADLLCRRYASRGITSENFTPELFPWLLDRERIRFVQHELQNRGEGRMNTDFRPVTYLYNLVLWDMQARGKGRLPVFQKIARAGSWVLPACAAVLLAVGLVPVPAMDRKRLTRYACFWTICSTGCAAMGMEILFIFMFQNIYGYIYEKIGLLVALFMAGIAVGGALMRGRIKKGGWDSPAAMALIEAALLAFILALPLCFRAVSGFADSGHTVFFSPRYVCFTLIFVVGLLAGAEFPLACHVLISRGFDSSRVAGGIDAMDHIGACCGACITGVICMPLFGVAGTCFVAASLKLVCILLLLRAGSARQKFCC